MKKKVVVSIPVLIALILLLASCPPPEPGGDTLFAPGGLTALAVSDSLIALSWTDTSSGETGSRIERSPNGSSSWTWVTTTAANATSFDDRGLTASTTYYYRVCATSGADDSGWSATVNATTLDPEPGGGSLMISEVGSCPYIDISSWLEVYNNTALAAQLGQFKLRTYARTRNNPWTFSGIVTFDLPSLLVQPGSYVLIRGRISDTCVNGTRVVYIDNGSTLVPNWVSDAASSGAGSGFVELVKDGVTVDFVRFGTNAVDPLTAAWSGAAADALPTGAGTYGRSISRDGALNDTNTPADWVSRAWATAGGANDVTSDTDADADGIPDSCEVLGSTFAGLHLYDWGARTGQKDVFIHVDYMQSTDPACTPRQAALDNVVAAFAAKGISVHFDAGTLLGSGPAEYNLDDTSHQVPFATAIAFGVQSGKANLYAYKNTYMDLAKKQVFHYLLLAYSQNADGSSGSSGLAELKGNDLIVTLGNWGLNTSTAEKANRLTNYQASTIMHEFGHNLGLRHGGSVDTNYMPNFFSIMNYLYQLRGLSTIGTSEGDRYYYYRCVDLDETEGYQYTSYLPSGYSSLTNNGNTSTFIMDYSDGSGGSISETSIVESQGLRRTGSTGVDFNGDGDAVDTVSKDLNDDGSTGTLSDYNDWAHLNLFFQREFQGDASGALAEDVLRIAPDPVGDDQQEVHTETLYRWMAE